MRPSNLTIPWRIALVVSVAAVFGHALWSVWNAQSDTIVSEPAWVTVALGVAWFTGIVLIVIALRKSGRSATGAPSIDYRGRNAIFRLRVPAVFEWILWLYLPVTMFSALTIGIVHNLGGLLTGLLMTVLVLGWPVFLTVHAVRYEVTDDALVIHQVGRRVTIKWGDISEVATARSPFAELVLITTSGGRTERIGAPRDGDRFFQVLAERAPSARFG
jgi:hypothetical protein